ncbi:MAG: FG-GAP-like repeat-containing protein [Rhodothermales bacterium]
MHQNAYKSSILVLALVCSLLFRVAELHGQDTPEPPFTYELIDLQPSEMNLAGLDYAQAAWGDQDLDGDLDLLLTGLTNNGPVTRVYINLAEEEFDDRGVMRWRHHYRTRSRGVTPLWLGNIAWIDFNNDGLLEFAVSGSASVDQPFDLSTRIYAPHGTEYVPISDVDLIGVVGGSIDWGDYDNDGDPDLLLTGQRDEEIVSRLYNNDNGSLSDSGIQLPYTSVGEAKFGDFDSDGDLDIILTGVYTPTGFATKLLRNNGGVFEEVDTNFPGLAFSNVDWGDYDNDGDLDIVLSGGVLSPLIVYERSRVFRNDGQGRFTDVEAALDDAAFGTARFGDYDNDGFLDIVIAGGKGGTGPTFTRFYRNQGDDTFVPALNLAGIRYGGLGFGDYDADGDLDVVVAGSGKLVQYRNDHRRVNNQPAAPTNLRTDASDGAVLLAWDAAIDVETPSAGLTYNIRIGSKKASLDVVSPMSNIDTGRRMVADMGNVQNNTSWLIRNLPPGTYYWSVQAIDPSFQGSSWAEEAVFDISASKTALAGSEPIELPVDLEVTGAYPNPFGPNASHATIEIQVRTPQKIRTEVYSALGAHVSTLTEQYLTAGAHRIVWDGRSADGRPVVSGIYFLRIVGEQHSKTIELVRAGS